MAAQPPSDSTNVPEAAFAWRDTGHSVAPVKPDGSKQIDLPSWTPYKGPNGRHATDDELTRWFPDGGGRGLGVVAGVVSGNLEFLDFDQLDIYREFKTAARALGLSELVERIEAGYSERTPKPGVHWPYYCSEIAGNTKLARRATNDRENPIQTLIETRGEGGYCVVAPSNGRVHESGRPYVVLRGSPATIATITPEERAELFRLARTFDELPPDAQPNGERAHSGPAGDGRPGDDFNRRANWREILEPHHWNLVYERASVGYWRRPGKDRGWSATTGYAGSGYLYVFSSSTPFEPERGYSKFSAYALLEHGEDFAAAARELASKGYGAQRPASGDTAGAPRGEKSERGSQADRLVRLVLATPGLELFHDQYGDAFARVPILGHFETMSLRSRAFRSWMSARFYAAEEKALTGEVLTAAIGVFDGQARFKGCEHPLNVRVARQDGAIWLDLGGRDWSAVRVVPGSWDIVPHPPILFRRFSHQRPHPVPERGGSLLDLLAFFNLPEERKYLLLPTLVTYLVPDIPRPGFAVHGPKGSAKTSFGRVLVEMLDPSIIPVRSLPHSPPELVQAAAHTYVLVLDNMSGISEDISNRLCRFVTGEGVSKRELYSDDSDVIYSFLRVLILNGINLVVDKPDLLDRVNLVHLSEISKKRRRREQRFWADFAALKPKLLGALLDALAEAMRLEPDVHLPELPRMADYARWGVAATRALGWTDGQFLGALEANARSQNAEALDASPVAQAVLTFMETRAEWSGTAGELLGELNPIAEGLKIDLRSKAWPKDGGWMGRRLREVIPNLREAGIKVTEHPARAQRRLTIRRDSGNGVDGADDDATRSDGIGDSNDGDDPDAATSDDPRPGAGDTGDGNDGISGDRMEEDVDTACVECGSPRPGGGACRMCSDGWAADDE